MSLKKQLIGAIKSGDNRQVSDVLEQMNVEVNEKDAYGESALHDAFLLETNRAVSILLAKPGINVKNGFGQTPLHVAVLYNNHLAVVQLLGCPGIDENARDNDGCTPIMDAAKLCKKEALGVMLESPRVDLDVKDNDGRGLEESVGLHTGNDKKKCVDMIQGERMKRKNVLENKKQESGEESIVGIGIEKIERISKKIEDGVQRWEENVDSRKLKRRELDQTQSLEMERLTMKHKNEKSALQETFDREDGDNEPPTRIWMCRSSHAICEACKDQLIRVNGGPHPPCPTCKSERVNQRAIIAEKFAESVFNT